MSSRSYGDSFDDYLAFIRPRLAHANRLLKPSGTFYLHLDYREAHYCKVLMDEVFGSWDDKAKNGEPVGNRCHAPSIGAEPDDDGARTLGE